MLEANFLVLVIRQIIISLLAALGAAWAIRKFSAIDISWKAAVIIGVVNGIVLSIILWFQ